MLFFILLMSSAPFSPSNAYVSDELSVGFSSLMLNITPEYLQNDSSEKETRKYSLVSSYAVLIDTFPYNPGDIQNLDTGREWEIVRLGKNLFHVHYKVWEDSFLKVDSAKEKVYLVSGGRFGTGGGSEKPIDGARFRKRGSTFEVHLPGPRLVYEPGSRVLNIYFRDLLVHTTGLRKVSKSRDGTYKMAFRVAGYLAALDIDFRKQNIRTIKTEDVFASGEDIPLLKAIPSDLYKFYPRDVGITITPGRKHFDLDGSSREFSPSVETSINSLDRYVLSYGQDWEAMSTGPDIYMLRYDEWEKDYSWKVDVKNQALFEISGGYFGSDGGRQKRIEGVFFYVFKGGNVAIHLPFSRLEYKPDAVSMNVFVKDRIFHAGNVVNAKRVGVDVYNITHRLASGSVFTWEVDFAMQTQKIVKPDDVASSMYIPKQKKNKMTWAGVVNHDEMSLGDMSFGIRKAAGKRDNDFAVVIGNSSYSKTKDVDYALNDAQKMKRYLIDVMGFREANVFYIPNANKGDFETYFGTESNHRGKLFNNMVPGKSDVFIYYSGHGAPGLNDRRGYFVPVEAQPNYVELGGYPLDVFYRNIEKLPAGNVTVVIDACFSGAEIIDRVSPLVLEVTSPIIGSDRIVVISSSRADQVSSWYDSQKHGLFTYFFLKALLDERADSDKDNNLTYKEIFDYVSDRTQGVPYFARKLNGVEQTPTIQGGGFDRPFVRF